MISQTLTPEKIGRIRIELEDADHGNKGTIVKRWAKRLGKSERHIQRLIGATSKRAKRCDNGVRRLEGIEERVEKVIRVKSRTGEKERRLTTATAIEIAEMNGLVKEGTVTCDQVNRIAREKGWGKSIKRHQRWEVAKPNQVHYFDASGSEYLYAIEYDNDREDWLLGIAGRGENYKNRRPKRMDRGNILWYYGLVDGHSRYIAMNIYVEPGENTYTTAQFLESVWRGKGEGSIIEGLPDKLMCDKKFRGSKEAREFLDALEVEAIAHKPRNPNAQGKIEICWKFLWTHFEIRYLVSGEKEIWLSEVKARLDEFLQAWNEQTSPSLLNFDGKSRREMWSQIIKEGIRTIPESIDAGYLLVHSYRRRVQPIGGGCVKLDKKLYELLNAPYKILGEWCEVIVNREGDIVVEVEGIKYKTRDYQPRYVDDFGGVNKGLSMGTDYERLRDEGRALGKLEVLPRKNDIEVRSLPVRGEEVEVRSAMAPSLIRGYRDVDDALRDTGGILGEQACSWSELPEEVFEAMRKFIASNLGDREKIREKTEGIRELLMGVRMAG